jgi:hypothetical protein
MARIPLQVAKRPLDTGNIVQYPQGGGSVGAAIAGFGNSLSDTAGGIAADIHAVQERERAKREREEAFKGATVEAEFETFQRSDEQAAVQGAAADGSGMANGVYGELGLDGSLAKPGSFDKRFDEFLERMPEGKERERFAAKRALYRQQGFNRLSPLQVQRRREHEAFQVTKVQDDLINGIMQTDPDDKAAIADFKAKGRDILQKADMDAADREKAIYNWDQNAEIALAQAHLKKDPTALKRLLGAPADPATATGGDAVSNTVAKIIGVESGGNATAKNPKSSATGAGQFIASTWMQMVRAHRPDLMEGRTANEVLALRNDGALSREMTGHLAKDNAEYLRNRRQPITEGTIYLAHFLGAQGAVSALTASPGASAASVLGEGVMNANPHLKGKTIGGVVDWASKKMGSATPASGYTPGTVDPQFENLTLDQRLSLMRSADAAMNDQMAALRSQLDIAVDNAPSAIQNTGRYEGPMPTEEEFVRAYGPQEGGLRYDTFQTAAQTAGEVYGMRTMPEAGIAALVKEAQPNSSGTDAALESKRYEILSNAAAETIKQRNADPASYVRQVFPTVDRLMGSGNLQAGIAASVAAQKQLGIRNIQPLTTAQAKQGADGFNKEDASQDTRIQSVTAFLAATNDPAQRRAIYEQMVAAGLPEMSQGAFIAFERGDTAASNRLFTAAMTNVGDLPGKAPHSPQDINGMIQDRALADGSVGDVYYGIGSGMASAEDRLRAERDSKLLFNAVSLRVRAGETLEAAVDGAALDVMGNLRVVTGNRNVNAELLVPANADADALLGALAAEMPKVQAAIAAKVSIPDGLSTADGTHAVFSAAGENYARRVGNEGFWRNAQGGYVFINPYTGPVSDRQGKPIIFAPKVVMRTPEEQALGPQVTAPPEIEGTRPSVGDTGAPAAPSGFLSPATDLLSSAPAPGPSGAPTPQPGDTAAPVRTPPTAAAVPSTSYSGRALDEAAGRQGNFQ